MLNSTPKIFVKHDIFQCYAKGRWYGKNPVDALYSEVQFVDKNIFEEYVESGNLKVNNHPTTLQYQLAPKDFISFSYHAHELPVTAENIQVIEENDSFIAVNKPPTIPVHATGKYKHNSLLNILRLMKGTEDIFPVHRLDRLTSGIVIFAKTKKVATSYGNQISSGKWQKDYIARVKGDFPKDSVECTELIHGKESLTVFEKISYNKEQNFSIVHCKPKTGRVHQIRFHLHHLGFPIENDFMHGGVREPSKDYPLVDICDGDTSLIAPGCRHCNQMVKPIDERIFLHSFRYKSSHFNLEVPWPNWATIK